MEVDPLWLILVSAALLALLFLSLQTIWARATACARRARAASRARSPDRTRTAAIDAESVSAQAQMQSKQADQGMSLVIATADRRNDLVPAADSRCLLVVVLIDVAVRARPATAPRASRRSTFVSLRLLFTPHLRAAMKATES